MRHSPIVTAAAVAAVAGTAVRLRVFQHGIPPLVAYSNGFSGRAVISGRWSTLFTSQLLTRDTFMATSIVLSLIVTLGLYEAIAGHLRATVVALTSAVASPLGVTAVLGAGSAAGNAFAARTLQTLDYGASAITAGAGGALVYAIGNRRLTIAAVVFVLGGILLHHQVADWEHLVAFPVGFLSGWALRSREGSASPRHRSRNRRAAIAALAFAIACIVGVESSALATSAPHEGRLIATTYPTTSIGGRRRILVYLPPGYDSSSGRYPVVELLHGSPGAPEDVVTGLDLPGRVASMHYLPPFIAVAPDGHGPVVADGDFADTSRQRLGGAVSDDLRRWVDRSFRTDRRWSVLGLSAGGFGAAYLATRTPGAYQRVCTMSGYFEARDPAFRDEPASVRAADSPSQHVSRSVPPTLLVIGDRDPDLGENRHYAGLLTKVGVPNAVVTRPGSHDRTVWRAGLPLCLRFFLTGSFPSPHR